MAKITYVTHDGREQTIDAQTGISVMENAIANGIDGIEAVCGGNAYCATCRVYPDPEWRDKLGERNDLEEPMLAEAEPDNAIVRLSCQIEVTDALDGLVVRMPETQE